MVNRTIGLTSVLLGIAFLSGCATLFSASAYDIRIDSEPDGAIVTVTDQAGDDVYQGETPTVVSLEASAGYFEGATYTVTVSHPDYRTQSVEISSTIDGWYWGNILLGGLIGMLAVDPVTGAMWTLNPQDLNVVLEEAAFEQEGPGLYLVTVDRLPRSLRSKLVRLEGVADTDVEPIPAG